MSLTTNLDLLLKEIEDPYVQENFYRLKLYLNSLESGVTTIIRDGTGGTGGVSIWEKFTKLVPASSTIIVDSLPLTSFQQVELIINYKQTVTKRSRGLKVSMVKDDTLLEEQIYAMVGAPLAVGLNTVINGSNYELQIVNSELADVEMSFARLILP